MWLSSGQRDVKKKLMCTLPILTLEIRVIPVQFIHQKLIWATSVSLGARWQLLSISLLNRKVLKVFFLAFEEKPLKKTENISDLPLNSILYSPVIRACSSPELIRRIEGLSTPQELQVKFNSSRWSGVSMNDFTSGRVWCSITNCPISRETHRHLFVSLLVVNPLQKPWKWINILLLKKSGYTYPLGSGISHTGWDSIASPPVHPLYSWSLLGHIHS